ncbi:MAG: hypothetical protein HY047_18225 [Acidobacteria bacterium]|nr:hypothetical protein [Acidobacteriota bacterium]
MVPPDDATALATAVTSLLNDAPTRARLSVAARQAALARFTLERLTADIADLYRQLLAR